VPTDNVISLSKNCRSHNDTEVFTFNISNSGNWVSKISGFELCFEKIFSDRSIVIALPLLNKYDEISHD
jgi:hypothetical protein